MRKSSANFASKTSRERRPCNCMKTGKNQQFFIPYNGSCFVTPPFLRVARFFAENEDNSGAKLFVTIAKMFGVMKHFSHFGNGCEFPSCDQEKFGTGWTKQKYSQRKEYSL